jgi:predicted flap endonuclease-1-like 5' DNA nuclease
MRFIYILVGIFLVWCLGASFWYLFWVKGLSPQPENINPHESALAIAEILIMILVSVFIGFALFWALNQQTVSKKDEAVQQLLIERAALQTSEQLLQEQSQKSELTLSRARETFREDFLEVSRENERLKTELEEAQRATPMHGNELEILKKEIEQLEEVRQKIEIELSGLKTDAQERKPSTVPQPIISNIVSDKNSTESKDDLKVINGIGPGIEKKLNKHGIFTYRQISEFTNESIIALTDVVKFFPGRIQRDRWVEQAAKLYLDKIRK